SPRLRGEVEAEAKASGEGTLNARRTRGWSPSPGSHLTMRSDLSPQAGRGDQTSSPIRSDPYQLLAEIGALQQAHERARRAVEAFGDEFAVFDLALAHPSRHVAQEIGVTRGKV